MYSVSYLIYGAVLIGCIHLGADTIEYIDCISRWWRKSYDTSARDWTSCSLLLSKHWYTFCCCREHLCSYAPMHLRTYAPMHLCTYAPMHLCTMHLCTYAPMHLHTYTLTHTPTTPSKAVNERMTLHTLHTHTLTVMTYNIYIYIYIYIYINIYT